jgi:transposase-like protein
MGLPATRPAFTGATQIDLIVTDGHEGRLSAVADLFSATPRQRCLVHKQRNVLNAIPRREHADVQAELVGIWEQPSKQEALTYLAADHQPSMLNAIQKRYEAWLRMKSTC